MTSAEGAPHPKVDLDALLVALVLVPHSYSRNRFFGLFKWPPARRVRRRAGRLRSLINELSANELEELQLDHDVEGGGLRLRYRLSELEVRRMARLNAKELGIVQYALRRLPETRDILDPILAPMATDGLGPIQADLSGLFGEPTTLAAFD